MSPDVVVMFSIGISYVIILELQPLSSLPLKLVNDPGNLLGDSTKVVPLEPKAGSQIVFSWTVCPPLGKLYNALTL